MNESLQMKTLPDGKLQVKMDRPFTVLELFDALGVSRQQEKKLEVFENGKPVTNHGLPMESGMCIITQPAEVDVQASYEPVDVVYEDDYCLVVDKPAFLLVHDDGSTPDNLQARVNGYLISSGWPFAAQAVNRIDREASGLVLFSKNPMFQATFDRQFEDHTAKKEYNVVLDGLMTRKHIDVNNPIGRDRHDARKMLAVQTGKPAHTHLERIARRGAKTLARADISTGRKHQIRVHAASQGLPVYNDELYGTQRDDRGLLLQSAKLTFATPGQDEPVTVELGLDPRFKEFFQKPKRKRRR